MADIFCLAKSQAPLKAHVIFLHGLGGHPCLTWQAAKDDGATLWPCWLAEEIEGHAIWSVGYETPVSRWQGRALHLVDRAENILGRLLTQSEFKVGRIILIGHSFGGLVIKQMLRILDSEAKKTGKEASFLDRINKIAFLATPHTGADLAILGDWLRIIVRPSAATMCLVRNDPYLRDLNNWYRLWADERKISHLVLRETKPIRILGTIVKADSADPALRHVRASATDTDHFTIAKPPDRNSEVFVHVKDFVLHQVEPPKLEYDRRSIADTG